VRDSSGKPGVSFLSAFPDCDRDFATQSDKKEMRT
jgi:hypothetical protein